jgi:hypothetical protein
MRAVQTLLQGSGGSFSRIPESYAQHLFHEYSDGSVSLLSKINTFEFSPELEDWQISESLEDLMKVSPNDWPPLEDIAAISLDAVYNGDYEPSLNYSELDFSEVSDMEYGNKVARMFKSAIESVFGQEVDSVGDKSGQTPHKGNKYCRDEEGFKGTFEHDNKKFEFELCKDDAGDWNLAYKLSKASRDKLFKPSADTKKRK